MLNDKNLANLYAATPDMQSACRESNRGRILSVPPPASQLQRCFQLFIRALPYWPGTVAPSGTNQISTRRLPAASVPAGLVEPTACTVTRDRSMLRSLTR